MTYEDLGYTDQLENYRQQEGLDAFEIGRVIKEHKERYIVKTIEKEFDSEVIGKLRYTANSQADFPAVGDWVAFSEYNDNNGLIHAILPRKTILERQAVGKQGEKQIIATNIDYAFIVQAVDRDFNINRIERYLTICYSSDVKPVVVLNKIDLISDKELKTLVGEVQDRIKDVPIFTISNETQEGIKKIKSSIIYGKTYCLLGSSGVGKSTLSNLLSNKEVMKTSTISTSTNKGKHTTSHRELLIIENGGVIIDNPGIREVGIADSSEGIETTFGAISQLAKECKFKDCAHTNEVDCAVISAVESGELDKSLYDNYLRMEREKNHYESTVAERRKKGKELNRIIKDMKSHHSKYR
ncbi:MAG: ribosome small subunit-dependent GTPase A [Balneola sp.]